MGAGCRVRGTAPNVSATPCDSVTTQDKERACGARGHGDGRVPRGPRPTLRPGPPRARAPAGPSFRTEPSCGGDGKARAGSCTGSAATCRGEGEKATMLSASPRNPCTYAGKNPRETQARYQLRVRPARSAGRSWSMDQLAVAKNVIRHHDDALELVLLRDVIQAFFLQMKKQTLRG